MEPTLSAVQGLIQSNLIIVILGTVVLLLAGNLWHHARRIRRLEQKLVSQHRFFRQELKMMNQGAIGVGHRVKHLEKRMRQGGEATAVPQTAAKAKPSPFEQLLKGIDPTPERQPKPKPRNDTSDIQSRPQATPSRAEQALADWMRDYQTTA